MSEEMKKDHLGLSYDQVSTRIIEKNYSPFTIRKYQMFGWPLFIGLIVDISLNDLDKIVYKISDDFKKEFGIENNIQTFRDYCGYMSEKIIEIYNDQKKGCVEGLAIIFYLDKTFISSLYGDFMTHGMCRQELYFALNMMPHM